MRLNQYLAKSGIASRRKAEEIIKKEKVTINDRYVDKPYYQVNNTDIVKINNKKIKPAENIYILVNKPKGVTTTCFDKFAKTTILDLIPKQIINFIKGPGKKRIYPIGRLDKNSTGLIVLTNNGDFCYKATHPKFEIEKEYIIQLSRQLKKVDYQKAKIGVLDQGELLKVKKIKKVKNSGWPKLPPGLKVTITEGKKRHLRRLFKKLGCPIISLKRISIGNLRLNELKEGECRVISSSEIQKIFKKNG
ncbi:MAG: rRNA pseudouridine synthase [Candidatus Omnitrophica bacterium]|nr:rRNA pseudouridine synthase [Candidatus Omnitrophota bacterium]MCF7894325.1 rRNA pseudouridine synthase [Candidatus Omnitrophota bacterium]